MEVGYYLMGGGPHLKKMKLGAAQANSGIIMIGGAGASLGVIPTTTTLATTVPAYGLAVDTGTYSATPAAGAEGIVTVDVRPDLVIKALMSGAATENTALTSLTQTSASSTVLTATVQSADLDGGVLWGLKGANKGVSRGITTHTSTTSLTVTVAFPYSMAVGDTFLYAPYNWAGDGAGGADGAGWVQTSTLFTQADASIAAGTGVAASVVDLILAEATNSFVLFVVRGHAHNSDALAA
jgi:hypothetical protein